MSTRYIELRDGITVEIGSPGERREEMHNAVLEQVGSSVKMVGDLVEKIIGPIAESFGNMTKALDVPIEVTKAEVELGLSFSAEGNIFVTKAKAEGSLGIKIVFSATSSVAVQSPPAKDD